MSLLESNRLRPLRCVLVYHPLLRQKNFKQPGIKSETDPTKKDPQEDTTARTLVTRHMIRVSLSFLRDVMPPNTGLVRHHPCQRRPDFLMDLMFDCYQRESVSFPLSTTMAIGGRGGGPVGPAKKSRPSIHAY